MNHDPVKEPVLRASKVKYSFGEGEAKTHVLNGVSLSVQPGEVCAIAGPSGCGKSTLLYLLGLLDQPDSGEIFLKGRCVSQASEGERTSMRNAFLGFVFQFHFLIRELTALENVALPLRKSGETAQKANLRAEKLLADLDLADKRHRPANKLSGGEQQRVAFARSLAPEPSLLMLDEPFNALDEELREELYSELTKIFDEKNLSVLLVTHDTDEARALTSRLTRLENGVLSDI